MIYAIVGTEQHKREKAFKELAKHGEPQAHLYSLQVLGVQPLIQASSLFGGAVVVQLIQMLEKASDREVVYNLLPDMKTSPNIFIIDEPFADVNRVKKLEKFSEKVFDAREEKEVSVTPFALCNAFARRDKKGAWLEWMALRDVESTEAIQGALWWKFQTVWGDVRSGRPAKFTLSECEDIGRQILVSSIEAHRGEKDLKAELERIVLSV